MLKNGARSAPKKKDDLFLGRARPNEKLGNKCNNYFGILIYTLALSATVSLCGSVLSVFTVTLQLSPTCARVRTQMLFVRYKVVL